MRIVLLPSAYAPAVGGVEELTKRLAGQLLDQGHVVEIWVNRHPSDLPDRETIEGIRVRRFRMVLPGASPRQLLRFPVESLPAATAMRRALREFPADVLHVQCFSTNGVYASVLSRLTGTPLVVTLQGETVMDDHDIYDRSILLRAGLRSGLRTAQAVTACSQFTLDDAVARFGLPPDKGVVVPNGVVLEEGVEPSPISLPFGRFVLAMGRVVEKKGFDLLLEAYARIAGKYPDVGLLIGGDGSARERLIAQAERLGLRDRVVLPGTLARDQVVWATRHADVFVLPSRVEPFGIVVLEAMAGGTPVIVSSRGGAQEIARSEVEGLVADPFDGEAMAAALERLLVDAELRTRLTTAARARVRDFLWPDLARRYLGVYAAVQG